MELVFFDSVPAGFCSSHELGLLWKGGVSSRSIELVQLFVEGDKLIDGAAEIAVIKIRTFLDVRELVVKHLELSRDKYEGRK